MRKRRTLRFTVTGKLLSIVVISIGIVITASGFGILQIQKIGQEIQFIAEAEVPLTEAIGHVTTHRLEQTILIEQLARASLLKSLGHSSIDNEKLVQLEGRILSLGNTITKELSEAQEVARKGIAIARTESQAKEFESILAVLEATSREHTSNSLATNQALAQVRYDNALNAGQLLHGIGDEQSTFNTELEKLLFKVQALTETAARAATEHEQDAIRFTVLISLGAAIFAIILAMWLSMAP
ncbi:MAG: hypothetical protein K5905_29190 [Roseibium sp.]|uniref:hypothetical protein n=1 Tax=Roseibium sp. TaxID=1936156 RepID=UPI0026054D73|nr:hypothetical protein [Roseibium sp.]MCV0429535.1 hypothetical protein [Roseibium sp.]